MRYTLKLLGLSLIVVLLAACGADEVPSQASTTGYQGTAEVVGTVLIQQGPVANAVVTVKTYDGQKVGTARTNAQGEYRIMSGQNGPFMAEAKDAAGKSLYSISQNSNMNITQLGDYLIRAWYKAKGSDVGTVFVGLNAGNPVPVEQELTVAANQILTVAANALGQPSVDLFGNELTPTLAKILQGMTVDGGGQLRISIPQVNFNGSYNIKTRLTKNGEVAFEGSEETSSTNVPLTKATIDAKVGGFRTANLTTSGNPMVRASWAGGSNEHWMKDNWEHIKDKRLRELVIPGTHDSGTYQLGWGTGGNTAKTQTNSIGSQLKDGIRYFDLRVREAHHYDCADPSVWWLFHTWDSYRLQVALDEIVAFLSKPGNESEVIILDFQDTVDIYKDERAKNVLVGMIQDKLGPYLARHERSTPGKGIDGFFNTWRWEDYAIKDLVSKNQRVVVLLEHGLYERVKGNRDKVVGCYNGVLDERNFDDRTIRLISLYDEDNAGSVNGIKKYTIDAQLNQGFVESQTGQDRVLFGNRFEQYASRGNNTTLRVLQLVSRPSNWWYAEAIKSPLTGYPNDLLSFATVLINGQLNYKYNTSINFEDMKSGTIAFPGNFKSFLQKSACQEGWLGKRLRMGLEGDPNKWNPPNIIIADNYNPMSADDSTGYAWVLPDYKDGNWVKDQSGGYVDMIIALNKIKRSNRLKGVTDMQDGQCLQ